MIIHLKYPEGQSVNDFIDPKLCTVQYCVLMQSLTGVLNFASRVIYNGRPFCRRLTNATCGLMKPHYHLCITKAIEADLKMCNFLNNVTGISIFYDRFWVSNTDIQLYIDGAGSHGFWCYFAGKSYVAAWPQYLHDIKITLDIMVLELFPIVVVIQVWGNWLQKRKNILLKI